MPVSVPAMLPTLAGIKRVVATAAGLERERCIEAPLVVAWRIVVSKVIVMVAWPQEQVVVEHGQIDHDRGRVVVAAPGINTGFKINWCKENAAPLHRIIPVTSHKDVS